MAARTYARTHAQRERVRDRDCGTERDRGTETERQRQREETRLTVVRQHEVDRDSKRSLSTIDSSENPGKLLCSFLPSPKTDFQSARFVRVIILTINKQTD